MADHKQEFHSLDELFRKTFDDLPESPSATGWDRPGDRVWQHVQARIKPGRQGWTNNQILLAAAAAVAIALGLYLAFARPNPNLAPAAPPDTTEQVLTPPKAEIPAVYPEATETAQGAEEINPAPLRPAPRRQAAPRPATTPDNPSTNEPPPPVRANTSDQRPTPTGSALLPGANPAPPNTTELRRNENAPRSPKTGPLTPLPTGLQRRKAPPLPESFKLTWPASDTTKQ